jgi:hypothetical protein
MRILGGIWLVQALTALVLWLVGTDASGPFEIALTGTLALGIGALAAVWILGTLRDQLKLLEARHSERLAQKSEAFKAEMSRQKAEEAARLTELVRNSGNSRTGMLRVGILTGGALGIGAALVMAQFIGLALVFAAFAGGGATGYALSNRVKRSTRAVGSDAVSDALAQTELEGPSKRLRLCISGQ